MASDWFGVRCLFRHGEGPDGATYEERVTVWTATGFDDSVRLAETEAVDYADSLDSEYLGLAQAFRLDREPGNGAEVFSLMRVSPLGVRAYLDTHFATGGERQDPLTD
jgi:hypothetical protein